MHGLKYTRPDGTTNMLVSYGSGTVDDLIAHRDQDLAQAGPVTQSTQQPTTDEQPLLIPTLNFGAVQPSFRPNVNETNRQAVRDDEPLRLPTMNFESRAGGR